MVCTSRAIIGYTFDEHTKIRAVLHHLAHRHLNLRNWKEICQSVSLNEISCDIDGIMYEGNPLDILFYVMDGFLPMMKTFLDQYTKTPTSEAGAVALVVPCLKDFGEAIKVI